MPPVTVDLRAAKALLSRELRPGHPGREALLAQPDELEVGTFDAVFPVLVRLLRLKTEG